MNSFCETIIGAFLGAFLALTGAYIMYMKQINTRKQNIKIILSIELQDIKSNIEKNLDQLNREDKNRTVQLMVNKVYFTPSNYDALRSDINLLKKSQISLINEFYRKIKELEEIRSYLVKVKERDIDLNEIVKKNQLSPSEGIIVKQMDIYANYFMNLDSIKQQIEIILDSID